MPKRAFWPAALIVIGFIFLATLLGKLPLQFATLWPVLAIVAGLGGLLISDTEKWMGSGKKKKRSRKKKKSSRKSSRKKK